MITYRNLQNGRLAVYNAKRRVGTIVEIQNDSGHWFQYQVKTSYRTISGSLFRTILEVKKSLEESV